MPLKPAIDPSLEEPLIQYFNVELGIFLYAPQWTCFFDRDDGYFEISSIAHYPDKHVFRLMDGETQASMLAFGQARQGASLADWTQSQLALVREMAPLMSQTGATQDLTTPTWSGQWLEFKGRWPGHSQESVYWLLCLQSAHKHICFHMSGTLQAFEQKQVLYRWILQTQLSIYAPDDLKLGPPWQTAGHFQLNKGLAYDMRTKLMWMRCVVGATWDGTTCQGKGDGMTWYEATILARDFKYQGYSDWRVPDEQELLSLVDPAAGDWDKGIAFVNQTAFPINESYRRSTGDPMLLGDLDLQHYATWLWTSLVRPDLPMSAGWVGFFQDDFGVMCEPKLLKRGVRLVRGGV